MTVQNNLECSRDQEIIDSEKAKIATLVQTLQSLLKDLNGQGILIAIGRGHEDLIESQKALVAKAREEIENVAHSDDPFKNIQIKKDTRTDYTC